jgi:molybdenum cofactor cytidylyltransferase
MIATLILAAGASTRMGEPKQLLKWKESTLIRTVAEQALSLGRGPVALVLGAVVEQVELALHDLPVETILNADWNRGMGTSVRKGIEVLMGKHRDLSGVMILVCDQPRISSEKYESLLATFEGSPEKIAAASYAGGVGVPAIFPKWIFSELLLLPDDAGARKIIVRHAPSSVVTIEIPEASLDIDTPEDYRSSIS